MGLVVVTPPSVEPVTVAQAKAHARILIDDDDLYLATLIKAARLHLERRANRSLAVQTLRRTLNGFPRCAHPAIELPRPPLIAVASIKYLDSEAVERTLDPSDYRLGPGTPGLVVPATAWPRTLGLSGDVTITYEAGWAELPEDVELSILILVAFWYDRREPIHVGAVAELPHHLQAIISAWDWRTR